MKKLFLMLLALTLVFSAITIPAAAAVAPEDTVSPMWTNTSNVDFFIAFVEGTGYAEATVMAKLSPKTIKIDVYVYVETDYGWEYVAESHTSKTGMAAGISCPFTPVSGAYYKAEYIVTVTGNGIDEVITPTTYNTCP